MYSSNFNIQTLFLLGRLQRCDQKRHGLCYRKVIGLNKIYNHIACDDRRVDIFVTAERSEWLKIIILKSNIPLCIPRIHRTFYFKFNQLLSLLFSLEFFSWEPPVVWLNSRRINNFYSRIDMMNKLVSELTNTYDGFKDQIIPWLHAIILFVLGTKSEHG